MNRKHHSGHEHRRDMCCIIATPCPVCQMNLEVYQPDINSTYATRFAMPVVYYSTLMAVAYGRNAKDAAL
ncbi:MAG: hypothetical protein LGR52_13745, partial [Candidatus Thiosymbion ectosymbiont of Robbea hypermnestra]|nr:hypothetical protein [Candidatus Thiosymbion ectosymbiont of Robbea hypermnestra]